MVLEGNTACGTCLVGILQNIGAFGKLRAPCLWSGDKRRSRFTHGGERRRKPNEPQVLGATVPQRHNFLTPQFRDAHSAFAQQPPHERQAHSHHIVVIALDAVDE